MFAFGSTVWPGLAKLIEECGEVQQVAGKLIATGGAFEHWDGTDLRDRLIDEIADLRAAIRFVIVFNDLNMEAIREREEEKMETFEGWHDTAQVAE